MQAPPPPTQQQQARDLIILFALQILIEIKTEFQENKFYQKSFYSNHFN